jgi:hypothetical protein
MRPRWHNIGVALAIFAGLSAMGVTIWAIVPQARSGVGPVWGLVVFLIGAGFLAAAFLVDRFPVVSKVLLIGGAVVLAASGILFGRLFGSGEGAAAAFIDLFPAILALVAGFLIGPIQTSQTASNRQTRSEREA